VYIGKFEILMLANCQYLFGFSCAAPLRSFSAGTSFNARCWRRAPSTPKSYRHTWPDVFYFYPYKTIETHKNNFIGYLNSWYVSYGSLCQIK